MLCFELLLHIRRRFNWQCSFLIFEYFFNHSWILLIFIYLFILLYVIPIELNDDVAFFSVSFQHVSDCVDFKWNGYQQLTQSLKPWFSIVNFSTVKLIGTWTKLENISWNETSIVMSLKEKKACSTLSNFRKMPTLYKIEPDVESLHIFFHIEKDEKGHSPTIHKSLSPQEKMV